MLYTKTNLVLNLRALHAVQARQPLQPGAITALEIMLGRDTGITRTITWTYLLTVEHTLVTSSTSAASSVSTASPASTASSAPSTTTISPQHLFSTLLVPFTLHMICKLVYARKLLFAQVTEARLHLDPSQVLVGGAAPMLL